MSQWTVEIAINVLGLGNKTVTKADVSAATIDEAIKSAIATILIEAVRVVKTGA